MMMVAWLSVLAAGPALAGTVDLHQQVRLLDAGGVPVNGPVRVEVRIVADNNPADADVSCFTQVSDPVAVSDGYASLTLAGVPDTCFATPQWTAVLLGNPGVEVGPRVAITAVPVAARAVSADAVNGVTFGQTGDTAADIKAYVDGLFCERNGGTWDTVTAVCDPNMVVGTGSYNAAVCPTGYSVCSVPQIMARAANVSWPADWHWASHEYANPAGGNLDTNGARHTFPHCPSGGDAPLVYITPSSSGGSEVQSVICYTAGYTPACCR